MEKNDGELLCTGADSAVSPSVCTLLPCSKSLQFCFPYMVVGGREEHHSHYRQEGERRERDSHRLSPAIRAARLPWQPTARCHPVQYTVTARSRRT